MLYKRLIIDGEELRLAVCQSGKGAPSKDTEGCVGLFYTDEITGDVYKCIAEKDGCQWELMPCAKDIRELEEQIAGLGGGGGAAGSVSWKDVTDKPFYEVEGEKEILAETTITVDVGIGETTAPLIGLTAGAAYRIVWNGTEYTATAIEATLLGYQAVVVGNTALVGGENSGNYPFLLGDAVEIGMGYFVAEDKNASSHTVAIYQDTTVIKTLDPKYLPEALQIGEEQNTEEILAEQELGFTYNATYGAYVNDSNPSLFIPVENETYTVVWDGEEYRTTAFTNAAMPNQVLMGNPKAIGGEDNGLPFFIGSWVNGYGMSIFAENTSATHRMAVYKITTVIKPLDPKFLPVAPSVDLTAFENDGIIVETYADGSTVTTKMERNAEGKVTKVTDSNGNVIVLTW